MLCTPRARDAARLVQHALQWLTYANPLRYYLVVIRGTFLKGSGLAILWPEFLAMAIIAAVLLTCQHPEVPEIAGMTVNKRGGMSHTSDQVVERVRSIDF
jgi:hypothetical protein